MAKKKDKEVQTTGEENRSELFQRNLLNREEIYELVKSTLEKTTDEVFKGIGLKKIESSAGEYGTGEKYGAGIKEGQYTVKYTNKTKSIIGKIITIGTKRIANEVSLSFDPENDMLEITYNGPENAALKSLNSSENYVVRDNMILHTEDINKAKKELKKFFENIANKEAKYILTTKIAVDDKVQKTSNTTIAENMSTNDLLSSSTDDIMEFFNKKMNESKEKMDQFSKNIQKYNTVNLADEEKTDTDGDDASILFDIDLEEKEEEIDEVTTSASAGAYNTPFAFKKGGDFDKEMSKNEDSSYPNKVKMNKGGWPPVGMEKDYVQGQHDLNESVKNIIKKEYKQDTMKRKFFCEEENKTLGINKRYLITDKLSDEQQIDKWKRLTNHTINETIHRAEDVLSESECSLLKENCEMEMVDPKYLDRPTAEDYLNDEFEEVQEDNDENFVSVEKPNSYVIFKFKKEDFLNENKKFIFDYTTHNYVLNPNNEE